MMPVHIIPYKLRARDITEKMIDAPFIPQGRTGWKDEIFEKKFPRNRKKIKKENS